MPLNPETLQADPCLRTDENGKVTLHAAGLVWQQISSTNKYHSLGIPELPTGFQIALPGEIMVRLRLNLPLGMFFSVLETRPLYPLQFPDLDRSFATFGEIAVAAVAEARKVITAEIEMRQAALTALPVAK
jgi:hypothetical protein